MQTKLEAARKLVEATYTAESWAEFLTALQYAEGTLANLNATQEDVDKALADLNRAMNFLVARPSRDTLDQLVAEAKKRKEADYQAESWNKLQEKLRQAEAVLAREGATDQEIADAIKQLDEALASLIAKEKQEQAKEEKTSAEKEKVLPQTGEVISIFLPLIGLVIVLVSGLIFWKRSRAH